MANLRALPIFNDEAIFLHGARLLREAPAARLWISLLERTPPLHTWLLALALPLSADPVLAGRVVSVVAAVLTVPALYALCRALDENAPRLAAFLCCMLYAASPLFAVHDRIARVEALFVLEMTVVALLSLRLAKAVHAGRRLAFLALGLGVVMGLAMLTRQAVSYVLWVLPVAAFWLFRPRPGEGRSGGTRRLAGSLAAAVVVALALWLPMLLARAGPTLATRILPLEAVREMGSTEGWMLLTGRNSSDTLSWLWLYLTPPVALCAFGGLLWAAFAGRTRLAGFLALWAALVLVPALPLSDAFFPRYVVPAGLPLLIGAGLGVAAFVGRTGRVVAALALVAVLAWPARDVALQIADWRTQKLAPVDRWQLVAGWPGGFATQEAVRHLKELAAKGRIVVITSPASGNPTDTIGLLLEGHPGVELASARSLDLPPFETTSAADTLRLFGDPRLDAPMREIRVTPETQLLYVSREKIYTQEGLVAAADYWRRRHPSLRTVARFQNPADARGEPGDAVVVLQIERLGLVYSGGQLFLRRHW